jgi:hypothetical protein
MSERGGAILDTSFFAARIRKQLSGPFRRQDCRRNGTRGLANGCCCVLKPSGSFAQSILKPSLRHRPLLASANMDEARRYHFPFHAYYPSEPVSPREVDPVPQYDSGDIENRQYSPSVVPRKPLPPQALGGDLQERNSTQHDRSVSSVDPRRSFSPSTATSNGTNTYAEKKERQLSQATGDRVASSGLQSVWTEEADKEVYRVAGYPSGTPSGDSAASKPVESPGGKRRIWGVPMKWFFIIAGLAACIIIGLGVGLGVGLGMHHS